MEASFKILMINMEIRKTKTSDTDTLMELYRQARKFMAEHGNPNQWGDSYPGRSLIEQDILDGCSYVCTKDGRIAATFFFRTGEDKTYKRPTWLRSSIRATAIPLR